MTARNTRQTRLNVNINTQTAAALKIYAERHEVSVTEAVRRLVNVGAYVLDAQHEGQAVQLKQRNGDVHRVVFDV